ncbi:MAG: glycosyltransferase, partial [Anaerolineales bacterium]|nr:glycosyltransferase [Anaerolineales bacterium]
AGLPIIAYESPGLSDIVTHSQTGLLSPPNDPAQLARHLHQLATNTTLRHRLHTAARTHSQQFDIAHTVQQTIALYDGMLVG